MSLQIFFVKFVLKVECPLMGQRKYYILQYALHVHTTKFLRGFMCYGKAEPKARPQGLYMA